MFRGYVPKFCFLVWNVFVLILVLNVFALFQGKVDHLCMKLSDWCCHLPEQANALVIDALCSTEPWKWCWDVLIVFGSQVYGYFSVYKKRYYAHGMKNLENFHYTDLLVRSKGYLIVSLCSVMFRGYVPKVWFSCLIYFRFNTHFKRSCTFSGKSRPSCPAPTKRKLARRSCLNIFEMLLSAWETGWNFFGK